MTSITRTLIALATVVVAALPAHAGDRGAVTPDPPVEPTNLFSLPTARVVRSMDLDVAATGVVLSEAGAQPLVGAVLGLGDIAQLEIGTIGIVSGIDNAGELPDDLSTR